MKILRVLVISFLFFGGADLLMQGEAVYAKSRPAAKKGKGKRKDTGNVEGKKEAPPEVKKEEPWKHAGGTLLSVSFSSDGKSAASVNSDGDILFWDIESGKRIRSVHHHSKATAAAFFGNKKVGLAGGLDKDNAIFILDLATGKETQTIAGHKGGTKTLAFSTDGESILSGGWNNQVVLWGAARGDIVRVFIDHDEVVNAVAASPDRVIAASGSHDGRINIWNMSTGERVKTINAHKKGVATLAFSPDGNLLLSGGVEKGTDKKDVYLIKLWDVVTGKPISETNLGEHKAEITTAIFSPNGKYALSGDGHGALKLWDVTAAVSATPPEGGILKKLKSLIPKKSVTPPPTAVRSFEGHAGRISSVAFSPDGTRVLAGGDGSLTIWETETGKVLGGGAPPAPPIEGAPTPATEKPTEPPAGGAPPKG